MTLTTFAGVSIVPSTRRFMNAIFALRASNVARVFGLALALFAPGVPANAVPLYSNLFASSAGADPVSFLGPLADSFSTGATGTSLTQVQVLLSGAPDTGGVQVSLLADAGTMPGSLIANIGTLSDNSLTGTPSVFSFVPSAPILLTANTRYWLQLAQVDANGTSAMWSYASNLSGPGVTGEYFANQLGVLPNSATDFPYQMQINEPIGAVPLPASLPLLGGGLGALVLALRRRPVGSVSHRQFAAAQE